MVLFQRFAGAATLLARLCHGELKTSEPPSPPLPSSFSETFARALWNKRKQYRREVPLTFFVGLQAGIATLSIYSLIAWLSFSGVSAFDAAKVSLVSTQFGLIYQSLTIILNSGA